MNLLNKIIVLLLLTGFYTSAYSAVNSVEPSFCGVYSDGDKKESDDKKGDKKEDGKTEEEPDCE